MFLLTLDRLESVLHMCAFVSTYQNPWILRGFLLTQGTTLWRVRPMATCHLYAATMTNSLHLQRCKAHRHSIVRRRTLEAWENNSKTGWEILSLFMVEEFVCWDSDIFQHKSLMVVAQHWGNTGIRETTSCSHVGCWLAATGHHVLQLYLLYCSILMPCGWGSVTSVKYAPPLILSQLSQNCGQSHGRFQGHARMVPDAVFQFLSFDPGKWFTLPGIADLMVDIILKNLRSCGGFSTNYPLTDPIALAASQLSPRDAGALEPLGWNLAARKTLWRGRPN